jgi:uncharacterized protein (TIGR04551 family)
MMASPLEVRMRRSSVLLVALTLTVASPAFAQFGPGGGGMRPPGGQPGGVPGQPPEKEEGPAEKAPEQENESPALQPLPAWPQQKEKQLQFFQLNGYIRFRAYLFHSLNLGFFEGPLGPRSPFTIPYTEFGQTGMQNNANNNPAGCAAREKQNCIVDNITSADMRMRLEPTVNVTEQVRVKAQLDVFDNMVLGSTPQGYYINSAGSGVPGAGAAAAPYYGTNLAFNSTSQQTQIAGVNSVYPSINAKRAWAEVRTPFGELRFGRMPNHWGTGMLVNNGDCLDCDYGSNADRVMFATKLWGHFIAFMWDWVATGPTTQLIGPQTGQGVFYNADQLDDVSQWILALGKQDRPEELKEKLDQGKIVFNYGAYLVYRQQAWDQTGPISPSGNSYGQLQSTIHNREAKAGTFDVWLRLNWRKLHIEAEGALIVGGIGNLSDIYGPGYKGSTDILSGGFVAKADYKLLRDSLRLYLEIGYASGDDSEDPNAVVNYRLAQITPFNNHIGRFYFDPDYHVDLILFRRILGTVYNATYFKPGISYDIIDNFGARVDIMYALANRPVGFPGNNVNLGLEIDAQLMYKNEEEGFYAGLVYGVLFPFGALSLPSDIYGSQYAHPSPDIAQTFQARLIVKF